MNNNNKHEDIRNKSIISHINENEKYMWYSTLVECMTNNDKTTMKKQHYTTSKKVGKQ